MDRQNVHSSAADGRLTFLRRKKNLELKDVQIGSLGASQISKNGKEENPPQEIWGQKLLRFQKFQKNFLS